MVSYWYFVRDLHNATKDSIVYRVKVGTSEREQVKFALVREFCRDCGLYFHQVSDVSDTAIRNFEKRLFTGSRFFTSPLRRASVTITDLYRMIIDDSFDSFEKSFAERKGTFNFHCLIDPVFYARQSQKKSLRTLPRPPRKYLKSEGAADWNSFLIGSAINIILFLIAAYLDGIFIYGL